MATNAYLMGINHPPGYPLYTIISHIFTYLPWGNIAFRINLMSAFFSSLASLLIFFSGCILFKHEAPATATAIIYAFSCTFWKLSLSSEVFAFHVFLASLLIFILLYWRDKSLKGEKSDNLIYICALLTGLCLCHHHTIILLFPALFFIILATDKKIFRDRRIIISLFMLFLGLLPYIYIPLRADSAPLNWGATDPDGFMGVVTRRGYGSMSLSAKGEETWSGGNIIHNLTVYFNSLFKQFTPILIFLLLPGFYQAFRKNKTIFIFFLLIFIFSGPFFLVLADPPPEEGWKWILERFYLLSFLPVVFLMGYGLEFIFLKRKNSSLIYLSLLLIFIPLFYNYGKVNNSSNYVYYDYIKNLLDSLPENSTLICSSDFSGMGVMYFQKVERYRIDIKVFQYGLLGSQWYIKEMRKKYPELFPDGLPINKDDMVKNLIEKKSGHIYIDIPKENFVDNIIPLGLVYRFGKNCSLSDLERSYDLLEKYKFRSEPKEKLYNEYFTKEIVKTLAVAYYMTGKGFQETGLEEKAEKAYIKSLEIYEIPQVYNNLALIYRNRNNQEEAKKLYLKSLELNKDNFEAYFNLGIIYLGQNKIKEAEEEFLRCLEIEPANPLTYSNLAILYEKRGEPEKAIESLREGIKLRPEIPDLYYNIAILLVKQKKMKDAGIMLEKARELGYPENEINKISNFMEK